VPDQAQSVPPFSADALARILYERFSFAPGTRVRVAFSGGLDSHVLLHAAASLRERGLCLSAIHVDHGLRPESAQWADHCRNACRDLEVPLLVERVRVEGIQERGPEDAARRARYGCFARVLQQNEVLLTAHQRDDQAETVLLQLLRAAGPHGLAAMPAIASFAHGTLARPLLDFGRAALLAYAREKGLSWIEDTSNRDETIARNFLRAQILPALARHWPHVSGQLARAAQHHAEASRVLDEVAEEDLLRAGIEGNALSLAALETLSPARQANVVRYWIRRSTGRMPPEQALKDILTQLRRCPRSRHALIRWPAAALERYRDQLRLVPLTALPGPEWETEWDPQLPLAIPGTGWYLRARAAVGAGLASDRLAGRQLRVRLRRGGEVCRLPGRTHHHKVKKLLQDAGVSPWERARLPLLYVDDALAAIGDRFVCEPFAARSGEAGMLLELERTVVR
jgi:tRNA(Ile)-lysidine synthase